MPRQEKVFKIETTLDRGDFFPFASSAVKGHFIEFLVSNILVTSLSFISEHCLANGTIFISSQHLIDSRYSQMWDKQGGCCPPVYFGPAVRSPCLIAPIFDPGIEESGIFDFPFWL